MSDTFVVTLTFLVSYALIAGYAVYLHVRSRSTGS